MPAVAFFSVPSTLTFRKQGQKHPPLSVEGDITIEKVKKPKLKTHHVLEQDIRTVLL